MSSGKRPPQSFPKIYRLAPKFAAFGETASRSVLGLRFSRPTGSWRRVGQLWQAALNRRSHKVDTGWKRMDQIINRWLPSPKVMHPYPELRFCVIT